MATLIPVFSDGTRTDVKQVNVLVELVYFYICKSG